MKKQEPLRGRDIINNPRRFKKTSSERSLHKETKTVSITLTSASDDCQINEPPHGVIITTPPPPSKKGWGPFDEITVHFEIDVAKITLFAFGCWLAETVRTQLKSVAGDRNLNADYIAEDEPAAISAIARKIDHQQNEDR